MIIMCRVQLIDKERATDLMLGLCETMSWLCQTVCVGMVICREGKLFMSCERHWSL